MLPNMVVQCYLRLYLFRLDSPKLVSVFFIDELNSDNGCKGIFRTGFPDANLSIRLEFKNVDKLSILQSVGALTNGPRYDSERKISWK